MTLNHGGKPKTVFRTKLKGLNTGKPGRVPSIASTIGALKSGAPSASSDLAKQKEAMVSIEKHRAPYKMPDELPAEWLASRIEQRQSTYSLLERALMERRENRGRGTFFWIRFSSSMIAGREKNGFIMSFRCLGSL